jgi:hypothetical protein
MKRTNAYALYAVTFVVSFVAGAATYTIFFA